jgi:4-carboxymuconolactone decarboxylase
LPRAIQEVCIQVGIYAGLPASEEALEVAGLVFAERGVAVPDDAAPAASLDALSAMGESVMRALHGERAAGGYAAPDNPVTSALYPAAIQWGYGEIWHRPGLQRRERALVAVAAFAALKLGQVQKFGESALNVGLSKTEVIEAIVQTGPYSGFAPALNALGALSDVLR